MFLMTQKLAYAALTAIEKCAVRTLYQAVALLYRTFCMPSEPIGAVAEQEMWEALELDLDLRACFRDLNFDFP